VNGVDIIVDHAVVSRAPSMMILTCQLVLQRRQLNAAQITCTLSLQNAYQCFLKFTLLSL